jgi:hypothetical protein
MTSHLFVTVAEATHDVSLAWLMICMGLGILEDKNQQKGQVWGKDYNFCFIFMILICTDYEWLAAGW